jgi:hypothetical protein
MSPINTLMNWDNWGVNWDCGPDGKPQERLQQKAHRFLEKHLEQVLAMFLEELHLRLDCVLAQQGPCNGSIQPLQKALLAK